MDEATAQIQKRTSLASELKELVAQRDAVDRTSPGSTIALARIAARMAGKSRELRAINDALAGSVAVLDALSKRAVVDKALMDMGYEPDPDYIERTYGAGWHRKPAPVLDSAPVPPAMDPVLALAAVTDRMADLIETQARVVTTALAAPPVAPVLPQIVMQPELKVTAYMPTRQTTTEFQRDPVSGDLARTIQTERDAPDA